MSSDAQVLDHLSLSSVAHNLHYKFQQGGLDPVAAKDYASRLLKMIGYTPDDLTIQAALQAWQQLYPGDDPLATNQIPAATTPTESWGYGTVSKEHSWTPEPLTPLENPTDTSSDWKISNATEFRPSSMDTNSDTATPLYHWTDASQLENWMDPNAVRPAGTYLTESHHDPAEHWNPDVPQFDHPVRLTIDPSHLDPSLFGPDPETGEGYASGNQWGNHYYRGVIPREAVSDMKSFKAPASWDLGSTVPSPQDRWPDFGERNPDEQHHYMVPTGNDTWP